MEQGRKLAGEGVEAEEQSPQLLRPCALRTGSGRCVAWAGVKGVQGVQGRRGHGSDVGNVTGQVRSDVTLSVGSRQPGASMDCQCRFVGRGRWACVCVCVCGV